MAPSDGLTTESNMTTADESNKLEAKLKSTNNKN